MQAARFFLCRSFLTSKPVSLSIYKLNLKTFSSLSCLTRQLQQKPSLVQIYKCFSKPQIKFEFLIRNKATASAATVAATAAADASIKVSTKAVERGVGLWLWCLSGLVFVTIVFGGYTRLTESGLSMVTWRLSFEQFPKNDEEWMTEFKKYQEYPEYKLLKREITLEEFKKIFRIEYFHRTLGRVVGLFFIIPAIKYWYTGSLKPAMKKRVTLFGTLILCQGLLGWYMVKSGLEDRFHKETDIPRVSQYRLAAHLGLALTLFSALLMTSLEILVPATKPSIVSAGARRVRMLAHMCKGFVFLTALSGALVAGLDAGLVYGSFPKMGDKWIPDDILALSPTWKNFTENPTTVQFDHRILGITTFSAIMATWILCKGQKLPKRAQRAANSLALVAIGQVSLGISTLVHQVPLNVALLHQSGSIILLTFAIWFAHELKFFKYIPK